MIAKDPDLVEAAHFVSIISLIDRRKSPARPRAVLRKGDDLRRQRFAYNATVAQYSEWGRRQIEPTADGLNRRQVWRFQ